MPSALELLLVPLVGGGVAVALQRAVGMPALLNILAAGELALARA